ncbi:MAG TPA: hypothetical protein VMU42_04575, partial [Candidatus Sulfotelmatobacter sp.]|nr:hypothetical protein [Candidatus Sulfotelmatobacter sp.]
NWDSIYYIIQDTVLHKTQSSSYQQRSFADMMAVRIFVETYAIGIGLGSHKANNMLLTLLSNTGILGLLCFVWFVLSLLRRAPFTIDRQQTEMLRRAMRPYQWGLLGLLLIHVFSNPNLSTIALWVEMGGLLALQAALHKLRLRQPDITIPRNMFSRSRTAEPLLHRIRSARRPLAT